MTRVMAFFFQIGGAVLLSVLITSLTNAFLLSSQESKIMNMVIRLRHKEKMREHVALAIISFYKMKKTIDPQVRNTYSAKFD